MGIDVRSFRDVIAWQHAKRLAVLVCQEVRSFPPEERFALAIQMRRSAISVPSNIAEGWARHSTPDYLRLLGIARGSLAELETQCEIASELGYAANWTDILDQLQETSRTLSGLITAIRRRAASSK